MAEVNKELRDLEVFEIDVIELLNSSKIIEQLFFGGGTMLRLCHNLNRYSTDLDFWLQKGKDSKLVFENILAIFAKNYVVIDSQNKFNTMVFQLKSDFSKRSLKIEIRKETVDFEWERKIAFSQFTFKQIQINGLTLNQMMKNKILAFQSRKIIRDAFDIDFLIKRGVELPLEIETLKNVQKLIKLFKERDFKVSLGSLLELKEREFYSTNKFNFLEEEIFSKIRNIENSEKIKF